MAHEILIVEDERVVREELAEFFQAQDIECAVAETGAQALALNQERDFSVILLDVYLPDTNGIDLLARLRETAPEPLILLMTAHPSVDTVVAALRIGAVDYITKPLILEDLLNKVRRLIEFRRQQRELRWYRQQLQAEHDIEMVGASAKMQAVLHLVERVAATDAPVLVTGESGTGKELVARAIHRKSPRADEPFVPVNCAAIPGPLLESQLFGHVRGAFTSAEATREGLFRAAGEGSLFLDEIGDLPLDLQPKLLRAIEDHSVLPVGGTKPVRANVRIIASTNLDLDKAVTERRFRQDLYYRLSVVNIDLPPLRDRPEDIPALVRYFIERFNPKLRRRIRGVANETLRHLLQYRWKGNIRELQNVLERAMILEDGDLITPVSLPSNLIQDKPSCPRMSQLRDAVRAFEQEYIRKVLDTVAGDKQLAAELLGVSVSSIYRRLQHFEDQSPTERTEC